MAAPFVGRDIRVIGLASRPELNGSVGKAVSYNADTGRYTVNVSSQVLALRPKNLEPFSRDSGGGDGGGGGGGGGSPFPQNPMFAAAQHALQRCRAEFSNAVARLPCALPKWLNFERAVMGAVVLVICLVWFLGTRTLLLCGALAYVANTSAGKQLANRAAVSLSNLTGRSISRHTLLGLLIGLVVVLAASSTIAAGVPVSPVRSPPPASNTLARKAYEAGYADGAAGRPSKYKGSTKAASTDEIYNDDDDDDNDIYDDDNVPYYPTPASQSRKGFPWFRLIFVAMPFARLATNNFQRPLRWDWNALASGISNMQLFQKALLGVALVSLVAY